jgi:hypothetical protein
MKKTIPALCAVFCVGFFACESPKEQQAADFPFLAKFKDQPLTDTMRFEVTFDDDGLAPGDTLPNAPFFASLDTAWLPAIENVADTAEAAVLAKGHFPLNKNYDAYLVDIGWNWFKHQSLLVYDKQKHVFTDRVTVSEWYGGDGGQVLTGSYLLDLNNDGQKDIVQREIDHSMVMLDNGEPQDRTTESASLLLWKEGRFEASPTTDTAGLVKRFPIESAW